MKDYNNMTDRELIKQTTRLVKSAGIETKKFELPPEAVAIFKDLVNAIIEHAKECDPVELLDPEQEKFYQAKIVVGLDEKSMNVIHEMKSRFNYYSPNPDHYRYSK